jgi:glycosyltransferase involved in cell wall biosynthesis
MEACPVVILAPGNSEQGGVGTYVAHLYGLYPHALIVTGETVRTGFYREIPCKNVVGFDRVPTLRATVALLRIIGNCSNPVLICNGTSGLLLGLVSKLLFRQRVRAINVFHGLASRYESSLLIRGVETCSAILSDDNVYLTSADKLRIGRKGRVIPNGVPRTTEKPPDSVGKEVVVVARHSPQKNIVAVLDLAARLPDFQFVVYGGGRGFPGTLSETRNRSLRNVSLVEWASPQSIYRSGAIFLLPTFAEGFPLSILEAASHGMPLVLSDLPELREICGERAQYFDNRSIGTLESIVTVLASPTAYREWSFKAAMLTDQYSLERWSNAWRQAFPECCM